MDAKTTVVLELEDAIEVLHGDIRSIQRQISLREVGIQYSEDPAAQSVEDKQWKEKAEQSIKRKIAQARFLERDLGSLRKGETSDSEKYFYISILLRIAQQASLYDIGFEEDEDIEDWAQIRKDLQHLRVAAPNLLQAK